MRGQTNNARRENVWSGSKNAKAQHGKHVEIDVRHRREEKERRARQIPGRFRDWQPTYAAHGIPTFPMRMKGTEKVPSVRGYTKVDLSRKYSWLTEKHGDAAMFGFVLRDHTLLDVDIANEKVEADALMRHGATPLIIKTASGKFHNYYKFNGERRFIRAWGDDVPIDLLGGGVAVAPPSKIGRGTYQIIQGSLDDLDRLPVMKGLEARHYRCEFGAHESAGGKENGDAHRRNAACAGECIPEGGRNNALFYHCMRAAHTCKNLEELLAEAETVNMRCNPILDLQEVHGIAGRAWSYTISGRNHFGQHGAWFALDEIKALTVRGRQDVLVLLAFLRVSNGPNAEFIIANGFSKQFGWPIRRIVAVRKLLLELGYVREVRAASSFHGPALYRWAAP
jgi:hypothetical protein